MTVTVGLIGDHDPQVLAHQAIPQALQHTASELQSEVVGEWIGTADVNDGTALRRFDGIWCVPASPYRSMAGALRAIEMARTERIPFLGTCAGFQHAVIEYARNVLGWDDADHAETADGPGRLVIAPLACSLVEETEALRLAPGSRLARAYAAEHAVEGYHCRYGLNPVFAEEITIGPFRPGAFDSPGAIRAVELDDHPFFVATLFQPERAALRGAVPPLVRAFLRACIHSQQTSA